MTGGLGNQMFIYAMYLRMKQRFPNTRIDLSDMMHYHVHNGYELHRVFPHLPQDEFCIPQALKKILEVLVFRIVLERHQNLDTLEAYRKNYRWPFVYFKGFYQDERYFDDISDDILNAFTFHEELMNSESQKWLQIIKDTAGSVSIHVRRGDYTNKKTWESLGKICQKTYYQKAIDKIQEQIKNASFFIFSDDMAWVRDNLEITNANYIECNKGADSWQDMMLMSLCRHNIICNSTFSWWGHGSIEIHRKWYSARIIGI